VGKRGRPCEAKEARKNVDDASGGGDWRTDAAQGEEEEEEEDEKGEGASI